MADSLPDNDEIASQSAVPVWLAQERLSRATWMPPWVRHEHEQRYLFASQYVRGKTVVDCACGTGIGTYRFAQAGAQSVIAVDKHLPAETCAQQAGMCDGVSFVQADATALPLPDGIADVFISLETIEHLERARDFLREVCRVLRSNGLLVVSTPNRAVTNPGKGLNDKPWNQHHVREYSQSEFTELLQSFFGRVDLFGQTRASRLFLRVLATVGGWSSGHAMVRLRQFLKLPSLFCDRASWHDVRPQGQGDLYEYLVAVCAGKKA
jgi:SAM-dependent methyltransferase